MLWNEESNNIFNVRKTGKDCLEQTNEHKKQAIDMQKHNDTIHNATLVINA